MENELINLRLTSKQMQRSAIKCTKNETAAKAKLREAIKAGNIEGARIYGQNAIREKNQSLNCLRLSSRIDAVGSRLETAIRMKQVWVLCELLRRLQTLDAKSITLKQGTSTYVPEGTTQFTTCWCGGVVHTLEITHPLRRISMPVFSPMATGRSTNAKR